MQVQRRRANEPRYTEPIPTQCRPAERGDVLHHFVLNDVLRVCVKKGEFRQPIRVAAGTTLELQTNAQPVIATAERNGLHIRSQPVLPYLEAHNKHKEPWIVVQVPG